MNADPMPMSRQPALEPTDLAAYRELEQRLASAPRGDTAVGAQARALVDRCEAALAEAPVEPIRTVHHFACTGGTVICKCIASMPNVQLLSEVDPLHRTSRPGGEPRFAPSDMPTLLAQSTRGAMPDLVIQIFQAELQLVHADARRRGQRLVLRDHAHTHFCHGARVESRPTLRTMVETVAPPLSLVTVRDPVDSYASLVSNAWVHFTPATFEAYCGRYLAFLDAYEGIPIVRFEDFARSPGPTMERICRQLSLPFDATFERHFSAFRLTGDSGRSSTSIGLPPRRPEAARLLTEVSDSEAYRLLTSKLGYEPVA
jgi:hypothetical protein